MDTSLDSIAGALRHFIENEQRVALDDGRFTHDVHLFEEGYLDSIGLVHLVAFIEDHFSIELDEEQLFSEDFTSINGISRIIRAVGAPGGV